MTILEIIELAVLVVIILGLSIFYLIKAIKNKWLSKIYNAIKDAIAEAEETDLKGQAKKEYVLNKVKDLCSELGVPYELIKKLIDRAIEKIIEGYNTISKSKKLK